MLVCECLSTVNVLNVFVYCGDKLQRYDLDKALTTAQIIDNIAQNKERLAVVLLLVQL